MLNSVRSSSIMTNPQLLLSDLKIRDAHHEAASTPLRQHISSPKTKGSRWYVLLIGSEERGSSGWLGSHHGECTTTGMRQRQRLRWQGFISGVPSSTPAQQSSSGMEPRVVVMIGHMKMARPHTHARTNERRRGIIRVDGGDNYKGIRLGLFH
ncbi:hypothetical protein F2Q68_00016502 [Brassica cretica]|uniref:Uncharacterized protein n=1 Tax=Brassica cretica TaxID=69181 RepID=A0A8S9HD27_BRACR|nr:hypothetical protein F2Q68_00016502 [Brassica cretica]